MMYKVNPKWLGTGSCPGSHGLAVGLSHWLWNGFYTRNLGFVVMSNCLSDKYQKWEVKGEMQKALTMVILKTFLIIANQFWSLTVVSTLHKKSRFLPKTILCVCVIIITIFQIKKLNDWFHDLPKVPSFIDGRVWFESRALTIKIGKRVRLAMGLDKPSGSCYNYTTWAVGPHSPEGQERWSVSNKTTFLAFPNTPETIA